MYKLLMAVSITVALLSSVGEQEKKCTLPKTMGSVPVVDYEVVVAIGKVETSGHSDPVNAVGDRGFFNKAYGKYQMRQPAVDDVNRFYGFQGIKKAKHLLGNREMQIEYARLYIKMLKAQTGTWEMAIDAYNQGVGNVLKGRDNPNKYYVSMVMDILR